MKKTPEEIEAMAKADAPEFGYEVPEDSVFETECVFRHIDGFKRGYNANNELEEFKKGLVEKINKMLFEIDKENTPPNSESYLALYDGFTIRTILDLITQEDQPEVKKEEKI